MSKLYVIRHAQVEVNPAVQPSQWQLSAEGRKSTERLIRQESWPDVSQIYHSPEAKAEQTAKIIAEAFGLNMKMHPDLRELRAELGILPAEQFQARVGAYLAGYDDPAFEAYQAATARIVECVRQIVDEANGKSVAIVTHGRILSVFFGSIFGRRLTVAEWNSIQLPDLSVIDLSTWRVERGFLSQMKK